MVFELDSACSYFLVTGGVKTRDGVLARWSSPHVKGNSTEQIWNRSHGLITCRNSIQMWEIIPMKKKNILSLTSVHDIG